MEHKIIRWYDLEIMVVPDTEEPIENKCDVCMFKDDTVVFTRNLTELSCFNDDIISIPVCTEGEHHYRLLNDV
jgi:hypothetical protein